MPRRLLALPFVLPDLHTQLFASGSESVGSHLERLRTQLAPSMVIGILSRDLHGGRGAGADPDQGGD
jgi:hypothetical protein